MLIHKMILIDKNKRPVAVQIPYKEWLEIESIIKTKKKKKLSISHLAGSIKLSEDPAEYQRRIRNEW